MLHHESLKSVTSINLTFDISKLRLSVGLPEKSNLIFPFSPNEVRCLTDSPIPARMSGVVSRDRNTV